MKKESGITLAALAIMIIILMILMGVSIHTGSTSIQDITLQSFDMQLELIQKRVDEIATTSEGYSNDGNEATDIQTLGTVYVDLTQKQKELLTNILIEKDIECDVTDFRYFTNEQLKEYILDLEDFKDNVFIHFPSRMVVAECGLTIEDTTYHMAEENPYFVSYNSQKNIGTISALSYSVIPYGNNTYKVTVTPSNNIGDIGGRGTIQYKKTTTKYWEQSNDNTMIIETNADYNLIYTDSSGINTTEKKIKIVLSQLSSPEYQEVGYIESTGTQYINTQIESSRDLNALLDIQYTATASDRNSVAFSKTSGAGRWFGATSSKSNVYTMKGANAETNANVNCFLRKTIDINFSQGGTSYTIDNVTCEVSSTVEIQDFHRYTFFAGMRRYGARLLFINAIISGNIKGEWSNHQKLYTVYQKKR